MRRMLHLWQGPATLAVYIPAPLGSRQAVQCCKQVHSYLQATVNRNAGKHACGPLRVSYLYTRQGLPSAHCRLSEGSTGLEPRTDQQMWAERFSDKPYIYQYDEEYPVAALRQLALDMVCPLRFAPEQSNSSSTMYRAPIRYIPVL